jgi:xylulokinase
MLPWFVPETTPAVLRPAARRYRLDPADGARNVRAVVEAQAMAMRLHSRWFAPRVETIRATGGASVNRDVLQVIADVFGADLIRVTPRNAASLGAALRAFHAVRHADKDPVGWDDVMAGFTQPAAGPRVQPDPAATAAYAALLPSYEALEAGATG